MARGRIETSIGADTKAFKQGIESGVIAPLEDAVEALDEVAEGKSLDQLTRDMEDAQDETKRLARETKKTADAIEDEYRNAYRSARASADTGLDGMRKQSAEVGQEIRQNLGEGIANAARGDFEGLADVVGDTLGGAVAGIGGIATAAGGAALALGVGGLVGAFQAAEEKRKELEERASDLADAYVEAGATVLDAFSEVERAQGVIADPEQRKKVEQYAATLGVDLSVALGAYVGRAEDLARVQEIVNQKIEENAAAQARQNASQSQGLLALDETFSANQRAIDSGSELIQVQRDAAAAFATYSDYLRHIADTTAGATRQTDEFGDSVVTLPDGKTIYIDAETGAATDKTKAIEDQIYSLPQEKTVTIRTVVDDSAWRNWNPRLKEGVVTAKPTRGTFWE